eukprot:7888025-Heterocapsa_arctica.AAC.1
MAKAAPKAHSPTYVAGPAFTETLHGPTPTLRPSKKLRDRHRNRTFMPACDRHCKRPDGADNGTDRCQDPHMALTTAPSTARTPHAAPAPMVTPAASSISS